MHLGVQLLQQPANTKHYTSPGGMVLHTLHPYEAGYKWHTSRLGVCQKLEYRTLGANEVMHVSVVLVDDVQTGDLCLTFA